MRLQDTPGSGSYRPGEVTFLLKTVSMDFVDVAEKERLIQSGARHYSEMISAENAPGPAYLDIYADALVSNGERLAQHINTLADTIVTRPVGPQGLALASLARAGTPIGVLLTLALRRRGVAVTHYSISIIRGRGLDLNAMQHILLRHDAADILFVDGWTGKGAIAEELRGPRGSRQVGVKPFLIVVADPAGQADLAATGEDYLIPSGILNGIVSGLVSRTILNEKIGPDDFHGCLVLNDLRAADVSNEFIDAVTLHMPRVQPQTQALWSADLASELRHECTRFTATLAQWYGIDDVNRIKPGIAEATRAVLRRVPDRLLINDVAHPDVRHLVHLAATKDVVVEPFPCPGAYRAVAIIASVAGE